MKIRSWSLLTLLTAALLVTGVAFALNGHDKLQVQFSHPVHVQGDTLPPGTYTIETMSGMVAGNNNIMQVYGANNMNFKTSFTTFNAKKMHVAKNTHVTLLNIGGQYYLDKVFFQGHLYGYQVVLSKDIQSKASSAQSNDVDGTIVQ